MLTIVSPSKSTPAPTSYGTCPVTTPDGTTVTVSDDGATLITRPSRDPLIRILNALASIVLRLPVRMGLI